MVKFESNKHIVSNKAIVDKSRLERGDYMGKDRLRRLRVILDPSLYITLHKLVGLNCTILVGFSSLGIRTMYVKFRGALRIL